MNAALLLTRRDVPNEDWRLLLIARDLAATERSPPYVCRSGRTYARRWNDRGLGRQHRIVLGEARTFWAFEKDHGEGRHMNDFELIEIQ